MHRVIARHLATSQRAVAHIDGQPVLINNLAKLYYDAVATPAALEHSEGDLTGFRVWEAAQGGSGHGHSSGGGGGASALDTYVALVCGDQSASTRILGLAPSPEQHFAGRGRGDNKATALLGFGPIWDRLPRLGGRMRLRLELDKSSR